MDKVITFLADKAIELIFIGIVFLLGKSLLRLLVRRMTKISDKLGRGKDAEYQKRSETLNKVILDNGSILIDAIILLMILGLFGVDIRPILAGLGILGLAVGFGAQTLVKDFVSGFFILIENQYNIGDKVQIGSNTGRVEKITLRSTVLVDDENKTFYISNGSIASVINFSQKS